MARERQDNIAHKFKLSIKAKGALDFYISHLQNDFLSSFEETLTHLRSDCEIFILGDFNICWSQRSSSILKSYKNLLKLFDLEQIIAEPTRITPTSSSLIDHILCNNKEKVCQSGTIPIGISDHFLTYCTI